MNLQVLKEDFTVCKLLSFDGVDLSAPFTFTGATDEEYSLVCPEGSVPGEGVLLREDGWRGFRIAGVLDFSLVGILSRISGILAEAEIGIFAVSTYNTDYVFLKAGDLQEALSALRAAGYETEEAK